MDIGVIGVNYKSADLNFRELLAKNLQKSEFLNFAQPFSRVVLSTCNRFEIYFHSPSLTQTHSHLLHEFTDEFNQSSNYKLYSYFGQDCFTHLSKVTVGLDSAILTETEIQGQVKKAYLQAHLQGTCSKELHFLFQKSLKIGKEMRSEPTFNSKSPSLTPTIINLLKSLKQNTPLPKLLFVGTSSINSQIIHSLNLNEFEISLASQSPSRGKLKSQELKVHLFDWKNLHQWNHFDGVVLATHYLEHLIKEPSSPCLNPKLILDLSVPRNADPSIQSDPNVKLFNIDQLNKMVRKYRSLSHPHLNNFEQRVSQASLRQYHIYESKNTSSHSYSAL